eukprot:439433-Pelagomonas_calceolata.AAC.2
MARWSCRLPVLQCDEITNSRMSNSGLRVQTQAVNQEQAPRAQVHGRQHEETTANLLHGSNNTS